MFVFTFVSIESKIYIYFFFLFDHLSHVTLSYSFLFYRSNTNHLNSASGEGARYIFCIYRINAISSRCRALPVHYIYSLKCGIYLLRSCKNKFLLTLLQLTVMNFSPSELVHCTQILGLCKKVKICLWHKL